MVVNAIIFNMFYLYYYYYVNIHPISLFFILFYFLGANWHIVIDDSEGFFFILF
jgi:hypothetical protein